jgi:hypothetical protein
VAGSEEPKKDERKENSVERWVGEDATGWLGSLALPNGSFFPIRAFSALCRRPASAVG